MKHTSALALALLTSPAFAQGSLPASWSQTLTPFACAPGLQPVNVDRSPDGSVFAAGTILAAPGNYDALLARYDAQGNVLFSTTFGSAWNEGLVRCAADGLGGAYLAGATDGNLTGAPAATPNAPDPFLARFDSAGNLMWVEQPSLPGFAVFYFDVCADGSGGAYAAQAGDGGSMLVYFIEHRDPSGALLWSEYIPNPVELITPNGSGGVLVVTSLPSGAVRIRSLDAAGNMLWAQAHPGSWDVQAGVADGRGGLLLAADHHEQASVRNAALLRIDGTGDLSWTFLRQASPFSTMRSVTIDAAGVISYFGQDLPSLLMVTQANSFLGQLGADGELLWWARDQATASEALPSALVALDAGRYLVWDRIPLGTTPFDQFRMRRYDTWPGQAYCSPANANSTGQPARLAYSGSDVLGEGLASVVAWGLPAGQSTLFLTSRTQGFSTLPNGSQGNLCLGGSIGRYVGPGQVQQSNAGGSVALALDLSQTPTPTGNTSVIAGETWNWQAWYRDVQGSNFTDAVSVSVQ